METKEKKNRIFSDFEREKREEQRAVGVLLFFAHMTPGH